MNGTSLEQRQRLPFPVAWTSLWNNITGRCSRKMCNRFLIEWNPIKGFNQLTFFFFLPFRRELKFICIAEGIFTKHEFSQIFMCIRFILNVSMCGIWEVCGACWRMHRENFHRWRQRFFLLISLPPFVLTYMLLLMLNLVNLPIEIIIFMFDCGRDEFRIWSHKI